MAIILYGVDGSPFVRKVKIFLLEKNLPFTQNPVVPGQTPPDYQKISPLKKIPALQDDGLSLADSSVICAYLERKYKTPALYPTDDYAYARALWFEEYGDSALLSVIGHKIFFPKVIAPLFFQKPADEAAIQKVVDEELPAYFDYLEQSLHSGGYLLESGFSIADIGIGAQLANLPISGYAIQAQRWPKLSAYFDRLVARPSFESCLGDEQTLFEKAQGRSSRPGA